ncbi:F0F1 ATP synthase assembly protein I [Vreelandella sulfidaeris]|uniref:F0F1 ATP synthase assembly protein I n=1 Tax=Vreelandella sulfidaeris TaxID=115553 RepID=A0A365TLN6_9GAMM|nr:ATP synthase subunit I [Halomonas sulfidaeris]RBI66722.1 F0F1 ATP synthase assembly protein I [Halomonas sulfidaeris]|tara:strand:+ start:348 stop:740 length:393 start_codon:yes stop_codon:yes gene_type:complete
MQRYETQRRKAYIARLTIAQLMITLIGMLAAYLVADIESMSSVFKGALVALLPHVFFIKRMGVLRASRSSQTAMRLFRAEAGKFGLTVALFVAVFVAAPPSNPTFFFYAYVAVVLTHWLTPWLMPKNANA